MSTITEQLPISETFVPDQQDDLIERMRQAHSEATAMYPIGGGTSLDYGLPAKTPGLGVSLRGLDRVIDYPARDMTITVEAGIPMARLAAELARENQGLPIDVPQAEIATLGGVVATAFSGARRYGWGTMRDYVIGIHAIDGRGSPFRGGGRVVKNVAGYDFCKLLTGSRGTLGIITQVTLKVKPLPESSALLYCDLPDARAAESVLAALVHSETIPTAVELLAGPCWSNDPALCAAADGVMARLVVGLEGSSVEVAWMLEQLTSEWRELGVRAHRVANEETALLWSRLAEFPAQGEDAMVVQASVLPSATAAFVELLMDLAPSGSVQAHAGNGVVVAHLTGRSAAEASQDLIQKLQPAARSDGGSVIVLSSPQGVELTRQAVWGGAVESAAVMKRVKDQFDPKHLLNPGRFIY